jgi:hypothetical protein
MKLGGYWQPSGPEMYRCGCWPINGKLEGQKAAVIGAMHNHNHFFTSKFSFMNTAGYWGVI